MSVPGTLNFPTSIDDVVSLFQTANLAGSTLASELLSGTTASMALLSVASFPDSGAVSIDDEIIFYAGRDPGANTLTTLSRGANSTTPATHSASSTVKAKIVARHHTVLADAMIAVEGKIGIGSSTPSLGTVMVGTGAGTSAWSATITAPTINGGTHTAITSLGLRSTGAAFDLTIACSEVLSAGRTLTVSVGNAARSLTVAGDATISGTNTGDQDLSTYATRAYAESLVVGLLDDRGNFDASVNTFPASGGSGTAGAILKGDLWTISVAGTLGGVAVTAGDLVRALVDTPGQTASNWVLTENNFGYVAANASLSNLSAVSINTALVPQTGIDLGAQATPFKDVWFYGGGTFSSHSFRLTGTPTGHRVVTFPDSTGTVAYATSTLAQFASTTSLQLKTLISDETGSGALVFADTPTLVTPVLGAATATSINGLTITSSTGVLTITNAKTFSVTHSLTLSGSDSTTMTFPASSATVAGLGISQTFTGIQTFSPTARSSGSSPYLTINAPADTGLTADTEAIGVSFVGATRQHADGTTQTQQREYVFALPTYSAAGVSIITRAATFAITGQPAAGANMTLTDADALWIQAGNLLMGAGAATGDFWRDINATAIFARVNGRLFVGDAVDNDGRHTNTVKDWMETLIPTSTSNAQLASLSTVGQVGVFGGTRTSDRTADGNVDGAIGLMGFGINDNTGATALSTYGGYFEGWMTATATIGAGQASIGVEIDIVNKLAAPPTITPYAMTPSGLTAALWLASGGAKAGVVDATVAIGILNNGADFKKGIVFQSTGLTGADGTEATSATAIEMASGHQIIWMDSGGTQRGILGQNFHEMYSTSAFFPQLVVKAVGDSSAGYVNFGRARAGTTAVVNGDTLGTFIGQGFSNAAYNNSVFFEFKVDGTVSGSTVPGAIAFTTVNAAGVTAERVRINSTGITNLYKGADVASASSITPTGNVFTITGTTTINTISMTGITVGTVFHMITASAVTFSETGNMTMQGAGTTLTTVAGDIVIGVWDGTKLRIR